MKIPTELHCGLDDVPKTKHLDVLPTVENFISVNGTSEYNDTSPCGTRAEWNPTSRSLRSEEAECFQLIRHLLGANSTDLVIDPAFRQRSAGFLD